MLILADSTALRQETTEQLTGNGSVLTPQAGITLIDRWLESLTMAENTKPFADQLQQLKGLLESPAINEVAVQERMSQPAELTSTMGIGMGSEGEMPGLLDGLASGLRQVGQISKAEQ